MTQKPTDQFEFTIIAGSLKGRTIKCPDLGVTRPPLTRLRRSIFDFLTPHLDGVRYLDLFSGTGSYLFEAVSRGVESAVGVEKEAVLAESIDRQALKFGVAGQLTCYAEDVFEAIPRMEKERKQFEIIMIAPPQYVGLIDRTLATFRRHPLCTSRGIIVCQHDTSETDTINFHEYPILQRRKYGNTTFTVLGKGEEHLAGAIC